MKKNTDPHQMTLGQFLLFLIVGGIAVIWLAFEVNMRLQVGGENIYKVGSYSALSRSLARTEGLYLPEKADLPDHDGADYFVITTHAYKLTQPKDGYQISLDSELDYVILCAGEDNPTFAGDLPLRADRTLAGTELELNVHSKSVGVSFLLNGFYYRLTAACPHGQTISEPEEALDTLLNIADHILKQAG